jgi:hypothetical protein
MGRDVVGAADRGDERIGWMRGEDLPLSRARDSVLCLSCTHGTWFPRSIRLVLVNAGY